MVKCQPSRLDSYWSENIRSPGLSLLTLMDPPSWFSVQEFPLGVRSCLTSLKAAHGGGFTVGDLELITMLPMIPVRPIHYQFWKPKCTQRVCHEKRLFSCDDKLSLFLSVTHSIDFAVFMASAKSRRTGSLV